jgi:hypothetical protein
LCLEGLPSPGADGAHILIVEPMVVAYRAREVPPKTGTAARFSLACGYIATLLRVGNDTG